MQNTPLRASLEKLLRLPPPREETLAVLLGRAVEYLCVRYLINRTRYYRKSFRPDYHSLVFYPRCESPLEDQKVRPREPRQVTYVFNAFKSFFPRFPDRRA